MGEEQQPRMIKSNVQKMASGKRTRGESHSSAQRPPSTSSRPSIGKAGPALGSVKTKPSRMSNQIVLFP
jgi:hypothetical protein